MKPDHRENSKHYPQSINRGGHQFAVIREQPHNDRRNQFTYQKTRGSHTNRPIGGQAGHFQHTREKARSEVISGYRLHPLVESHDNHHKEEGDAVDDAISSNRHVSSMLLQTQIDEKDHQARAHIHQERGHSNGEDAPHNLTAQPVNPFTEMKQLRWTGKMNQLSGQGNALGKHGRPGCTLDSPAQDKDEERVQDAVDHDGEQRRTHRHLRETGRTEHRVQAQIHVGYHIAAEDDLHIFFCVWQCLFACPEEIEYRLQENQKDDGEGNAHYQVQSKHIPQYMVRPIIILLPQFDGDQGGCSHAHQRPEGCRQVHQREGQCQSCYAQWSHTVADEYAVRHVIQRRGSHGNDGRDGEFG